MNTCECARFEWCGQQRVPCSTDFCNVTCSLKEREGARRLRNRRKQSTLAGLAGPHSHWIAKEGSREGGMPASGNCAAVSVSSDMHKKAISSLCPLSRYVARRSTRSLPRSSFAFMRPRSTEHEFFIWEASLPIFPSHWRFCVGPTHLGAYDLFK